MMGFWEWDIAWEPLCSIGSQFRVWLPGLACGFVGPGSKL